MKSKYVRLSLCIVMALLLLTGTALAADRGIEYTINRLLIRDCATMEELYEIPQDLFLAEAEITNDSSAEVDAVMLVQYSSDGQMIGMQYLYTRTHVGETSVFGAMMDNRDGSIGCIKAFVVPAVGNMVPLAESVTYGEEIEVEPMPDPEPDPTPEPDPEPVPGVYTTAVKSGTIYADLGLSQSTWATVIRNGEMMSEFQIKKESVTRIGGNGVLIEAEMDENGEITLYITDYYLAQVVDVLGDVVTIEVFGYGGSSIHVISVDMELQEDEYVLVTIVEDEIWTVEPVTTVNGILEAVGAASTYTILDGVQYRHSMHLDQNDPNAYTVKFNAEMNLLLDKFGYMIGLLPTKVEAVLDGYVLVTDSECASGGLTSDGAAVVEVLHLDGTGYEVLNLQTRRATMGGQRVTQFKDARGSWNTITADQSDMIPYGFYGYNMTENGEIVLKELNTEKRREAQILSMPSSAPNNGADADAVIIANVGAIRDQQFVFGNVDDMIDLILDHNSTLHMITSQSVETYIGYKNFAIDEQDVDALVVYKDNIVQELYVVNGSLYERHTAYYNGTELEIRNNRTYIYLYVDGELRSYKYDSNVRPTDGIYMVEVEDGYATMTAYAYEQIHASTVLEVRESSFDVRSNNDGTIQQYLTYAEDVEIYDLTQGGARVDALKNGDQVLYIQSSIDKGGVITHVWILKHYSAPGVTNDPPIMAEANFTKEGNSWNVQLTNYRAGAQVEIQAYSAVGYTLYETYSFTMTDSESWDYGKTYDFSAEMYFEVWVNGEVILITDMYSFIK